MTNGLFLGVDAGGSRTRAVLTDDSGAVLSAGEGGGCNPNLPDRRSSVSNLTTAVRSCLRSAEVDRRMPDGVCVGMAGVGGPVEMEAGRSILIEAGLSPGPMVPLVTDAEIALAGALAGRPGTVIICGTGSCCLGRDRHGDTFRSGGWGPLLGDEGSGYDLGMRALRAVCRMADRRQPASPLMTGVLSFFNLTEPRRLVAMLHGDNPATKSQIAAVAPVVLASWREGDAAAGRIVESATRQLAEMILAVEVDGTQEVSWAGGLIEHAADYRDRVISLARAARSELRFVAPVMPPVQGAALLARTSIVKRKYADSA